MATNTLNRNTTVEAPLLVHLTRDQVVDSIDAGARRRLGVSAEELVLRYHSGRLPDPGAVADLLALLDLLPEDDPLVALPHAP